jgi:hypothetical protein
MIVSMFVLPMFVCNVKATLLDVLMLYIARALTTGVIPVHF